MDNKSLLKTIKELRDSTKKRNFNQSFDFIVTLRDINLKNTDEQVDFFANLPHGTGKKNKVVALVGPDLKEKAEKCCDLTISQADFDKYKDKKIAKKLAINYDFFIAQADIMPKVAGAFGRTLGPRNKMPNPKLGTIIPVKGQVEPLYERLQKTTRVTVRKSPMIQVKIGTEAMKDEQLVENIISIHEQIIHHLPKEKGNVRGSILKLTMSKPVKVE